MAFNYKTKKQGHDTDRLSLLPDTTLIDILSRLPLQTAVSTEVLSPHWRGLWTQITSIDIVILELKPNFDCIMRKFTSPFIHTFNVTHYDHIPIDSWLRRICKRSLRHFRHLADFCSFEEPFPSFLFQTHSLVSIDLDLLGGWCFPENIDTINLPNLVTLSLSVAPSNHYGSLEKLIESCPSLEKLSLQIVSSHKGNFQMTPDVNYLISIKLSNANLRWLYIAFYTKKNCLSINAPMLQYLAIRAEIPPTFCFDKVPIGLHEAKTDFYYHHLRFVRGQSDDTIDLVSKFYETISNVTILHICIHTLIPVTIFRNVTRLTLAIESNSDCFTILSVLVNFSKLNFLIIKVWCRFYGYNGWTFLRDAGVSVLRQVKRIDIDANWGSGYNYDMRGKHFFSQLAVNLLRNATVLEQFNFSTRTSLRISEDNPIFEEREHMFCRLLYDCPRASKDCEVSFTGRCLVMSGKTVPNVLKANGEVLPLNT